MIEPEEVTGVDEDTALRVIAYAISIAPCLDELPEGRNRKSVIAILIATGREVKARGSRQIKSQRIGPAGVDYIDVASCLSADDHRALRAMCSSGTGGGPIGQFPTARPVTRLWPEDC